MKISFKYNHKGINYLLRVDGATISVLKEGEQQYVITEKLCSCLGYRYNGKCHHYFMADKQGLIKAMLSNREEVLESLKETSFEDFKRKHLLSSVKQLTKKFKWTAHFSKWIIANQAEYSKLKQDVPDAIKGYCKKYSKFPKPEYNKSFKPV